MKVLRPAAAGEVGLHHPAGGVQHGLLGGLPAPGLGKGVQLLALDAQHRLEVEHRADGGGSRGAAAPLFQILEGVHGNIDVRVKLGLFQQRLDLRGAPARGGQGLGVQRRLPQGDGDALVVDHLYPSAVVLGQHHRRLAGAAQAAGHGDVNQLVIVLQNPVPQLQHVAGGGLGGLNVGPLLQTLVKLLLTQGDVLQKELVVDVKGHGHHKDTQLPALGLGYAAVAVCGNGYFAHKEPLSHRCDVGLVHPRSGAPRRKNSATRPSARRVHSASSSVSPSRTWATICR